MKRLISNTLLIFVVCVIASCSILTRQGRVLNSLGKYDSKQFWTHGGFQDYTDFGKYSYSSVKIDRNKYFKKVSSNDVETIYAFIDNYEEWIDDIRSNDPDDELVSNYSFDRDCIDTEDYFYIYENEEYSKFGCYDVWIFDSQSMSLYYFYNNI